MQVMNIELTAGLFFTSVRELSIGRCLRWTMNCLVTGAVGKSGKTGHLGRENIHPFSNRLDKKLGRHRSTSNDLCHSTASCAPPQPIIHRHSLTEHLTISRNKVQFEQKNRPAEQKVDSFVE